jgi:hypothetical protein
MMIARRAGAGVAGDARVKADRRSLDARARPQCSNGWRRCCASGAAAGTPRGAEVCRRVLPAACMPAAAWRTGGCCHAAPGAALQGRRRTRHGSNGQAAHGTAAVCEPHTARQQWPGGTDGSPPQSCAAALRPRAAPSGAPRQAARTRRGSPREEGAELRAAGAGHRCSGRCGTGRGRGAPAASARPPSSPPGSAAAPAAAAPPPPPPPPPPGPGDWGGRGRRGRGRRRGRRGRRGRRRRARRRSLPQSRRRGRRRTRRPRRASRSCISKGQASIMCRQRDNCPRAGGRGREISPATGLSTGVTARGRDSVPAAKPCAAEPVGRGACSGARIVCRGGSGDV